MGTRTGWLALLLTAGIALAPTGVRGQELPPEDPPMPLPLGHDRMDKGGFYAFGEFVMFRMTNPLKEQVIAVRGFEDVDGSITADVNGTLIQPIGGPPIIQPGTAAPGTFYGSLIPALDANQAAGPRSYQPGWRLGLGWRFRDGSALEFSWMSLTEAQYPAVASVLGPLAVQPATAAAGIGQLLENTFLFSPVFNFPNEYAGAFNKLAIGNPLAAFGIWNGASVMSISFLQRYQQYDITYRVPIFETDYCRCYGLIGPRHVSIWENFKWRTVSEDFLGNAGQDDVALYSNIVSNQLYGVDIGLGSDWYLGHGFAISLEARVTGAVDIVHEIAKYERADFEIESKRAKRDYTFSPEIDASVQVWWYPIEGVQIRAGYDIMNFFETISSPQPVSFNYGGLDPAYSRHTYRFMDGFNIGIGFIF
jgi:hypothetical protein